MAVVVPTLCELYAAGKLHEFTQVLRPSPATKPNSSSSSNPSSLGATPSKSPRHHGAFAPQHASNSVVNRRDIKGRTALHLAASDLRNQAIPFLDALLAVSL